MSIRKLNRAILNKSPQNFVRRLRVAGAKGFLFGWGEEMRIVSYPRLSMVLFTYSRCVVFISGLLNALMGLYLAFGSEQPSPHLSLLGHYRLPYVAYIFKGHGFLVAQLGFLELFATFLHHPIAYLCAAFVVSIGDVYFSMSIYAILNSSYVPDPAGEPEILWLSVYWAVGEAVAMCTILIINWPRFEPHEKKED